MLLNGLGQQRNQMRKQENEVKCNQILWDTAKAELRYIQSNKSPHQYTIKIENTQSNITPKKIRKRTNETKIRRKNKNYSRNIKQKPQKRNKQKKPHKQTKASQH